MNKLEKCAEILVKCKYADWYSGGHDIISKTEYWLGYYAPEIDHIQVPIQVFADTLEGIKQLNTIENYLHSTVNLKGLWLRSMMHFGFNYEDCHQWRKDRIGWCIEELCNEQNNKV